MSFSEAISKLKATMEVMRGELDDTTTQISELENERSAVVRRPAHTEDIVAVFQRGLVQAERDFEEQFKRALNDGFVNDDAAASNAGRDRLRDILRLDERKLSQAEVQDRAMKRELPGLNLNVLAYFLRDKIGAELPALVERLCPGSQHGIKAAERVAELARIDAELAALKSKRDRLVAELTEARKAVNGQA